MITFANASYLLFRFSLNIDLCWFVNHKLPIN